MNDYNDRKKISSVIETVIRDRVYKFNQEQIDIIIKDEMNKLGVDGYHSMYYWECYYNILNYLVVKRELIKKDDFYIPIETRINDYYDVDSRIIAYSNGLIRGSNNLYDKEDLFDIRSCSLMGKMETSVIEPIILTGYLEGDYNYKKPDVSIEEISGLYHKFINQGATVDEVIQYILNYYNAVLLPIDNKYSNRYKISPKVRSRIKMFY